jgi:hypothetical protein
VSQKCALRTLYPLGAFPTPKRYQLLQFFPAPLLLIPESAVTMAGATACDGGNKLGSCAVAQSPELRTQINRFEKSIRKPPILRFKYS